MQLNPKEADSTCSGSTLRLEPPAWGIIHSIRVVNFTFCESGTSHTKKCFKGLPFFVIYGKVP